MDIASIFQIKYLINCFRYPSQWREIAIDPQVKTADGQVYDILFIGTDKVRIFFKNSKFKETLISGANIKNCQYK